MATGEARPKIDDPEAVRAEWLGRLDVLVDEVERWARASGWRGRRVEKTVQERRLGTYRAPVLLLEKDAVQVVLNPVARLVPGAEGAVDLYRAPAYDDIASLTFEGGEWVVEDCGRPGAIAGRGVAAGARRPYSEETVRSILDEMAVGG